MTDQWGIDSSYLDQLDREHHVPEASIEALREVIGLPPEDLEQRAPLVTRPGRPLTVGPGEVKLEDGTTCSVAESLPKDFPPGYHHLRPEGGSARRLIVSPGRCHLPAEWRAWGWAVQLYATRSRQSWGMGDLADLRSLIEWSKGLGAGFLLVNPLHASAPTLAQEPSPYLPTSRRFRNPIYLRPQDIPGSQRLGDHLTVAAQAGRKLNDDPLIDRDEVWRLKLDILQAIYDLDNGGSDFADWREPQGRALEEYARWCALTEVLGASWPSWPAEYRRPDTDAVHAFGRDNAPRVAFHSWLQWALEQQLQSATAGLSVIQDLPIGFDPAGADAWVWQDLLADGVTVGTPPDLFNADGQEWGLPPFVPWKLREAGYQPFIDSIRDTMAQAGGLRIDHVMGLFRLWWIPRDRRSAEGAYVRYPSDDLLDIVALESHRAGAPVVGEDLGTVEDGVREALAERALLSYRLLWFEDDDPAQWPAEAMAAVSTHDLPTVAGLWTGADLTEQKGYVGEGSDELLTTAREELLARITDRADIAQDATAEEATATAYRLLAGAPSILKSATLDDAVGERRRPNMPGAMERPNWSLALPVPLEELRTHPGAAELAGILGAASAQNVPGAAGDDL